MKILYINCSRVPTEKAHGLQMVKMCEAFADLGATVELWIPKRLNFIKKDAFDYYGVKRNFAIKKILCIDFIVADMFLGPIALWLTELTFLLFVFIRLLTSSLRLRRREEVNKPEDLGEIVYTRDKFLLFFLSFFKRNIFFEAHVIPPGLFFGTIKRSAGIVVITRYLKDIFAKLGVAENNIIVAPDGVDLDVFDIKEAKEECRNKLGLPQDKKIVLYTGHLYPWKGASTLLGAAKFLISNLQFLNTTLFVFVGGIEKDIEKYNLEATSYKLDNVLFVGHRPHREIPYWLKAADVLVLPNSAKYDISKYWTSPIKMFEYMAAGKPIVASDLPSIREVLSENSAILVEPDRASALALAITDLFDAGSNRDAIAARARENVKEYIWSKRAKRILEFIARRYMR